MSARERSNLLRAGLLFTMVVSALGIYYFARPVYDSGLLLASRKWQVVAGLLGLVLLINLILAVLAWTGIGERLLRGLEAGLSRLARLKSVNLVLFAIAIAAMVVLVYGWLGGYLASPYTRLAVFSIVALSGCFFLWGAGFRRGWPELLVVSLLLTGAGFRLGAYLPDISSHPFTLSWSEASRYYYASLFFSERIYGESVSPTVLHPSRYLLQAAPFLIENSPLWLHRLWQVLLWVLTTVLAAFLLANRLKIHDRLRRAAVIAWTVLFLLLGPVYYHLQVPVLFILWLHDSKNFWRSLGVVLLASAWAGISRLNWFPVPAMLASALYLLEMPLEMPGSSHGRFFRRLVRYLAPPAAWGVLGMAVAFATQALYALLSGNPAEQFTSSFTSDLIWYRLFPNPTYPLGILPATLLVSIPLCLLIAWRLRGAWSAYHPLRLSGLAALLLVLLAGGLVVSTKIGGGSNLHNLDAYLALLMIVTAMVYFGRFCPDRSDRLPAYSDWEPGHRTFHQVALALAVLVPLYFTLPAGAAATRYSPQQTQAALETIRSYIREAAAQGGEVLFISERQLLTFHQIEGVALTPEYEKVFLMEMAMAGNPAYLGRFRQDLERRRFSLIVSEPLFQREKGSEAIFGEENDAWVQEVSKPVLCSYRPKKSLLVGVPIQLLVPRPAEAACP